MTGRLVVQVVLLSGAALALAAAEATAQGVGGDQPPPAVIAQEIVIGPVGAPETFTGTVEAIQSVDILARVQGFIETVSFEAGQQVRRGDALFEIEPDLYRAQLASAEAGRAQAEALRFRAERERDRQKELVGRNVAADVALEQAEADFRVAEANLAAAEANVELAAIDLSYTEINAPIAGEIGRALISEGNLVGPGSGPLARIVALDPVRVVFSVPDQILLSFREEIIAQRGTDAANRAEAEPGLDFGLHLSNGSLYEQPGRVEYVASEVDPSTGTTAIRLIFDNPDGLLVPGQFATVIIEESDLPELPIVPQTAVLQDREGRFVYEVGGDDTVAQRRIVTGARVGNGWAVTEGLAGGEIVVVQGIQRLQDGMPVRVTLEPPSEPPSETSSPGGTADGGEAQ